MKFLTAAEVSLWLKSRGFVEDPHHATAETEYLNPQFHVQFEAPVKYSVIEAFLRQYLSEVVASGEVLLQIVDWMPYYPSKEFALGAFWKEHGAPPFVEGFPGCLIGREAIEEAIFLFTLITCFRWQCYLYSSQENIVLFNWEGEIMDFWTESDIKFGEFRILMNGFKFEAFENEG